jgi:hypothetical protein
MSSFMNSVETVSFGVLTGGAGSFSNVWGGGGENKLMLFTNDDVEADDNV